MCGVWWYVCTTLPRYHYHSTYRYTRYTRYAGLPQPLTRAVFDRVIVTNIKTTFNNGSLGSRNDEERSKVRYLVRFA